MAYFDNTPAYSTIGHSNMDGIFTLKVLAVCFVAVYGDRRDASVATRDATVGDQLRYLIDEETSLRERLASRIKNMRQDAASLTASIVPCSCPPDIPSKPRQQISYTGKLPADKTSLTPTTTFDFTSDMVNIGQPYHTSDHHFRVPVNGIYAFSLTTYMASTGYWTDFELVQNGVPITLVKHGHYSGKQVSTAANYVIVNATAGEEVWPRYLSGSARIWADGITTFSGVLLYDY